MTWNKDLPIDAQKLRTLASVIRENWYAIQTGDDVGVSNMLQQWSIQLADRSSVAGTGDPLDSATTHYLYSKNDGSTQELYTKDAANNVIQLTNAGTVGSETTNFTINQFQFEDNATTYNQGNIVKARATISAAGSVVNGDNITASYSAPNYTVSVAADVLENGAKYQIQLTNVGSAVKLPLVTAKPDPSTGATTDIVIQWYLINATLSTTDFDIIVTGGV